jgi:G:T/U-mismatch repair DNA glycosylase
MVVNEIMEGVRPRKPEGAKHLGFSNELWRTVEQCWLEDRNARPGAEEILSSLNEATAFWY